jgi:peptidoglycan hydrolase-like protein with peptidoglycan-binding domain
VSGVLALAIAVAPAAPALASSGRLGSRTLRQGMSGPDVRTLQTDLSHAGFRTPSVGTFGPVTERNVKGFERRYHLKVNGTVDAVFLKAMKLVLFSDASATDASTQGGSGGTGLTGGASGKSSGKTKRAANTATDPTSVTDPVSTPVRQDGGSQHLGERTLKPGMHGHDVRVLQGYLTIAGYATNVDGDFGPTTKTNVVSFEQAQNLTADGTFTYADSLVLRQVVGQQLAGGAVTKATINSDGTATAPSGAPPVVAKVIAAANKIIGKPYVYGGGHGTWNDSGYDCSGSVSYALHGANLLSASEDSTGLESYGSSGPGKWITVYADASHTWIVVAGIAFDTADFGGPNIPSGTGPRWRSDPTGNLADGGNYVVRHPSGL